MHIVGKRKRRAVFLFLNIFRQEFLIDSSVFCDLYSSISYLCVKSVAGLYLELCLETCLLLGRRLVTVHEEDGTPFNWERRYRGALFFKD